MAKQRQEPRDDADPNAMALESAIIRIVTALRPVSGTQNVPLAELAGRVCAEDVIAPIDVPPFRASAMDGYAFRFSDATAPEFSLRIAGRSLAGHPGIDALDAGTCQRITTGARVPDDADTVVQQEDINTIDDTHLRINELPSRGENVRVAGSDTPAGDTLVKSGQLMRGADAAV